MIDIHYDWKDAFAPKPTKFMGLSGLYGAKVGVLDIETPGFLMVVVFAGPGRTASRPFYPFDASSHLSVAQNGWS